MLQQHHLISTLTWAFCMISNWNIWLSMKTMNEQTFLACQQEELLIQGSFLFHLSHIFQGQKFIRRGGVRALIQSCHYDGDRARPNTDVHPTRNRRPSHKKARPMGWHWRKSFFFCFYACCCCVSQRSRGLKRRHETETNFIKCCYCRRISAASICAASGSKEKRKKEEVYSTKWLQTSGTHM